jgi:hypothetical protein
VLTHFGKLPSILLVGWTLGCLLLIGLSMAYRFTRRYGLKKTDIPEDPSNPLWLENEKTEWDIDLDIIRQWPHLYLLSVREHCLRKARYCGAASDSIEGDYMDWVRAEVTLNIICIEIEQEIRNGY